MSAVFSALLQPPDGANPTRAMGRPGCHRKADQNKPVLESMVREGEDCSWCPLQPPRGRTERAWLTRGHTEAGELWLSGNSPQSKSLLG